MAVTSGQIKIAFGLFLNHMLSAGISLFRKEAFWYAKLSEFMSKVPSCIPEPMDYSPQTFSDMAEITTSFSHTSFCHSTSRFSCRCASSPADSFARSDALSRECGGALRLLLRIPVADVLALVLAFAFE